MATSHLHKRRVHHPRLAQNMSSFNTKNKGSANNLNPSALRALSSLGENCQNFLGNPDRKKTRYTEVHEKTRHAHHHPCQAKGRLFDLPRRYLFNAPILTPPFAGVLLGLEGGLRQMMMTLEDSSNKLREAAEFFKIFRYKRFVHRYSTLDWSQSAWYNHTPHDCHYILGFFKSLSRGRARFRAFLAYWFSYLDSYSSEPTRWRHAGTSTNQSSASSPCYRAGGVQKLEQETPPQRRALFLINARCNSLNLSPQSTKLFHAHHAQCDIEFADGIASCCGEDAILQIPCQSMLHRQLAGLHPLTDVAYHTYTSDSETHITSERVLRVFLPILGKVKDVPLPSGDYERKKNSITD